MKRNILVESLRECPVSQHEVEIVERKGVGHPDSICDAVMEKVSIALSKEYISRFGSVLHHNIDKGLLVAGEAEHRLAGGTIRQPMKLIIGDRATFEFDGQAVPVEKIAVETAKRWFRDNMRFVDPDNHVNYEIELRPGSPELTDIFTRPGELLAANDTSAAVGYAPLTDTETLVLASERFINSYGFKERFQAAGEDVKVMGFRQGRKLYLTVAMALVDRFIDSEKAYFRLKREMTDAIEEFVNGSRGVLESVAVDLNTLDAEGRGLGGMYLTVTGTSAEDADSGEVGRGNRVNGIIALNRPTGAEAAAGKNPVSHVGKIYSILAHRMAGEVFEIVRGVREVYVWLCSQIGSPIDRPLIASAQLILETGVELDRVSRKVKDIIDFELENIKGFTADLAEGKYPVL